MATAFPLLVGMTKTAASVDRDRRAEPVRGIGLSILIIRRDRRE